MRFPQNNLFHLLLLYSSKRRFFSLLKNYFPIFSAEVTNATAEADKAEKHKVESDAAPAAEGIKDEKAIEGLELGVLSKYRPELTKLVNGELLSFDIPCEVGIL